MRAVGVHASVFAHARASVQGTEPDLRDRLQHYNAMSYRLLDGDLLSAIGPRPTLVVSGTQDKYSRDADQVVAKVAGDFITELRVERGHALDQERFDAIVEWICARVCEQAPDMASA